MRRLALAAALVLGATFAPPAQASAYVEVSYTIHQINYEGESYVIAYCEATSNNGGGGDIPTQTGVTCSVNGIDVFSMGPGTKAYVVATHYLPRPVTFCWQGVALFFDNDIYTYARHSARQCLIF